MTFLAINLVNGTETDLKKRVSLQSQVYTKDVKSTGIGINKSGKGYRPV